MTLLDLSATIDGLADELAITSAIAAIPPGCTLDADSTAAELQTFITDLGDDAVGYLRGGEHAINTVAGTVTVDGTGVRLLSYPGELATYIGPQFRFHGEGCYAEGVTFDQAGVLGKCIEADGADNGLLDCVLTNNDGAGTAGGHCPMILWGGSGLSTRFTVDGCFFRDIGKTGEANIFDHANYLQRTTGGRIINSFGDSIRGGYFVHLYSGSSQTQVRTLVSGNRTNDSYFAMLSLGAQNTLLADNIMRNTLTGIRAPALETDSPGVGNYWANNKCHNTDTARGGVSGVNSSGGCTTANTETGAFSFVDPTNGNFDLV